MEKTKDKLEQAARVQEISVCPYNNNCSLDDKCYNCQWGGASKQIRNAGKEAFIAGANWQKEQSPWISIDERFPDDKEQVLVSSQIYGKVVLVWDKLGMVWVYPGDNDVYCDWDKVDCWMPIPE